MNKSLLIKADFWGYEEEHRIIEHEGPPGTYKFPAHLLDGIIIGARMSENDKNRLLDLVRQRQVDTELLRAGIDESLFRVTISPMQ